MTWAGVLAYVFAKSPQATGMISASGEMLKKKIKWNEWYRKILCEEMLMK